MTTDTDQKILADYLDERDAACPTCGYNLRAVSRPVCPECGQTLTLGLRHPNPLWGRRGLLTLLFCWLVLAGSMNATREGRAIHASLTAPRQLLSVVRYAPAPTTNPFRGRSSGVTLGNPTVTQTDEDGNVITYDAAVQFFEQQLQATPRAQLAPVVPQPAGLAWSSVSVPAWISFGGWSTMALLAIVSLVLLILCRKRIPSRRLVRVLTIFAWVGFGGYFAYHGWSFVNELI